MFVKQIVQIPQPLLKIVQILFKLALRRVITGITCLMIFSGSMCLAQNSPNDTPPYYVRPNDSQPVYSQQASDAFSVRTKLAKTVFSGLAGAALGLSSLSFYGKPEEHLSNIVSGFGIGLILGAAYIVYGMAVDINLSSNEYSKLPEGPELWVNKNSKPTTLAEVTAPIWFIPF